MALSLAGASLAQTQSRPNPDPEFV